MYIIAIACSCTLLLIQRSSTSCELPKFLTRCKRNDPRLAECWRSVLEEAPYHLAKGIPKCHIPPIDPWKTPSVVVSTETLHLLHTNAEHGGTKHFEVIDNTINSDITLITLKLRFPQLNHVCTLIGNGTFLNFTLSGKEGCNEALADVTLSFVLEGEKVSKKGKDYIAFNNYTINADGKYTNQTFYNLMDGIEGDEKLRFQTEKQPNILNDLYNIVIEKSIGKDFVETLRHLYMHNPLDKIHPL